MNKKIGNSITVLESGTAQDVAKIMVSIIKENYEHKDVINAAEVVAGYMNTEDWPLVYALAYYAYKCAYFHADPPTRQTIRKPQRTISERRANCVDYTVLICSIAKHFTKNVAFEICAVDSEEFNHVRPVINGDICDVVPAQNQEGVEFYERKCNSFTTFVDIYPTKNKFYSI